MRTALLDHLSSPPGSYRKERLFSTCPLVLHCLGAQIATITTPPSHSLF